ncbi:hypothetical protein ADEAN_000926500 [Angomonas deanei]|uniref:Uncharacterized protein n=1 Tax=Angomonas deanei TaxID=59799 RepID=A0A7G2CPL9_9TRYP|nr:hypothetical protein ADEAN_000926500 [Angomonas deanei]
MSNPSGRTKHVTVLDVNPAESNNTSQNTTDNNNNNSNTSNNVVQAHVIHQISDYENILSSIGDPNYRRIRGLLEGDGETPAETLPNIQVSFELFEIVQNRFAATKQTLERTKNDLLTRNQQYSVLEAELAKMGEEYAIMEKKKREAEDKNLQLHQQLAKNEVHTEQLRKETLAAREEMETMQQSIVSLEEELVQSQQRVAETLVSLSQRDAVVATLRRELGKYGRGGHGGGSAGPGGNTAADGSAPDTLQDIAEEVEGRSNEARMKLSLAEYETKYKKAEEEKLFILSQHDAYLSHVEEVVSTYESQCMTLEDAIQQHACVTSSYFTSSTYYESIQKELQQQKETPASDFAGLARRSG